QFSHAILAGVESVCCDTWPGPGRGMRKAGATSSQECGRHRNEERFEMLLQERRGLAGQRPQAIGEQTQKHHAGEGAGQNQ
ncbi:MAG: hypothetical protein QG615_750, partial [Nitrospirota bacterium]|nr:hypothetical protein [Nitrospirota bacterium]